MSDKNWHHRSCPFSFQVKNENSTPKCDKLLDFFRCISVLIEHSYSLIITNTAETQGKI